MASSGRQFAAILAGGAGTRFWPASRQDRPKPFLDVLGSGPLLGLTADRTRPVVGSEGLLFILGEHLVPPLGDVVPGDEAEQVVGEPLARNTLGAVLLALGRVLAVDENARLAVLPADHVIQDGAGYQDVLRRAFAVAEEYVVTLGIVPAYPETGYGYIRRGNGTLPQAAAAQGALPVAQFTEKPDAPRAAEFVKSGEYYWNAGIFVMAARPFVETARAVDPYFGEVVDRAQALFAAGRATGDALRVLLEPLPNVNIDKAVMEHCPNLAVIPADIGWSDVGTWDAVYEVGVGEADNLARGDVLVQEADGNVVVSTPGAPLVAVRGVRNMVVVATPDAVLVVPRGRGQEVGEVVRELRRSGREELL